MHLRSHPAVHQSGVHENAQRITRRGRWSSTIASMSIDVSRCPWVGRSGHTCATVPNLKDESTAGSGWSDRCNRDKDSFGSPFASQILLAGILHSGMANASREGSVDMLQTLRLSNTRCNACNALASLLLQVNLRKGSLDVCDR